MLEDGALVSALLFAVGFALSTIGTKKKSDVIEYVGYGIVTLGCIILLLTIIGIVPRGSI
jgi:hypothetical protein